MIVKFRLLEGLSTVWNLIFIWTFPDTLSNTPGFLPSSSSSQHETLSYIYFILQNVDHKCKFRSKKGLLPFIELNGEEIADSNMIIETLSKKFEKEMPAELSQDQKNVQHAMIAMVENHLHW